MTQFSKNTIKKLDNVNNYGISQFLYWSKKEKKIEKYENTDGSFSLEYCIIEKAENKWLIKKKLTTWEEVIKAFKENWNKKIYISVPFYTEQWLWKPYWFIVYTRNWHIYLKQKTNEWFTWSYTKAGNRRITAQKHLMIFDDEMHEYRDWEEFNDIISCEYENKKIILL